MNDNLSYNKTFSHKKTNIHVLLVNLKKITKTNHTLNLTQIFLSQLVNT